MLMRSIAKTEPTRSKVSVSGSMASITKYEAIAVKTMEPQLPRFKAFITELSSPLMRTKNVPMMENTMPKPAITIGNKMGERSPFFTMSISAPSTIVASMVAT